MKMRLQKCAAIIFAAAVMAGCTSGPRVRDVDVKGMYVNGYTETLAIGAGHVTAIPDGFPAFIAHYIEDTAWLSPNTKTHQLDIFITGTNGVEHADAVVEKICKAFIEKCERVKVSE